MAGEERLHNHSLRAVRFHLGEQCVVQILDTLDKTDQDLDPELFGIDLAFLNERRRAAARRIAQERNRLDAGFDFPKELGLPARSGPDIETPVMLPPGRERLWTSPAATGSEAIMTSGTVCVVSLASCTVGVVQGTITSI